MRCKTIDEFPNYEICENGEIYSKIRKIFLKKRILTHRPKKREMVGFSKNGKTYGRLVNRLLAQAFIPNPKNKPQVNHKDGNPMNNSLENLEWCTHKENVAHAVKHKLYCQGEKHYRVILNWEKVREIRSKYVPRKYTYKMLAEEYGVGLVPIMSIVKNINWKE